MLSIITITHNESRNIEKFLNALLFFKQLIAIELIIVDSGSSDDTLKIIADFKQKYLNINMNIHVYEQKNWQGFGYQKNYALSFANGAWILSLDADEFINRELAIEITKIIKNTKIIENNNILAYYIKRQNYFCGKKVTYSGWQNDIVLRLWQKNPDICFSDAVVHESVIHKKQQFKKIFKKPLNNNLNHQLNNQLKSMLEHQPYQNHEDILRKIQNYSSLGAQKIKHLNTKKTQYLFSKALIHGTWAFIRTYFIKLGILDKSAGFNIALMNALASYYKYLKIKD